MTGKTGQKAAMEISDDIAFEDAMAKLEAISARLADENAPLDEAISLYEQGVAYYGICKRRLDDANRRILVIEKGSASGDE
ncbi:MAG: exodeoxyribonuclease VII small subunit [Clostridiales Family XIII bacterium]|nr:exodeoxyribonuclease VII small subunit [Clostridiales Family XIII bacterium]